MIAPTVNNNGSIASVEYTVKFLESLALLISRQVVDRMQGDHPIKGIALKG
jgi:hypothetical protein